MNPQVSVSGKTLSSAKQQFVTRKYVGTVTMASSTFDVKTNTNALPSGCKILRVRVKNLTGRTLAVQVPSNTCLIIPNSTGSSTENNAFSEVKRFTSAPLSRFPVLDIEVPDLLANPIDVSSADPLFTVSNVISAQSDTVEIEYTVRYAL